MLISNILEEKEKKIKEGMLMMGCPVSVFWLSWFLTALAKFVVLVLLTCFVVSYAGIFSHTDTSVLFVFLTLFGYVVDSVAGWLAVCSILLFGRLVGRLVGCCYFLVVCLFAGLFVCCCC